MVIFYYQHERKYSKIVKTNKRKDKKERKENYNELIQVVILSTSPCLSSGKNWIESSPSNNEYGFVGVLL